VGTWLETECETCSGNGWLEITNVTEAKSEEEVRLRLRKCYMCGGEGCFKSKKPGAAQIGGGVRKRTMQPAKDLSKIDYSNYKKKEM